MWGRISFIRMYFGILFFLKNAVLFLPPCGLGASPAPFLLRPSGYGGHVRGGTEFVSGARHCEEPRLYAGDAAICVRYKNSCLGAAKRRRMGGSVEAYGIRPYTPPRKT